MKKYKLVFLNTGEMLLSAKQYSSWKEIQDEYENYSASLDFDSLDEIKEYIIMDYKIERSFVEKMIAKFIDGSESLMSLEF